MHKIDLMRTTLKVIRRLIYHWRHYLVCLVLGHWLHIMNKFEHSSKESDPQSVITAVKKGQQKRGTGVCVDIHRIVNGVKQKCMNKRRPADTKYRDENYSCQET